MEFAIAPARYLPAVILIGLFHGATCSAQDPPSVFKIGSHGAKLQIDEPWERRRLQADLGEDQFALRKSRVFAVVFEFEGPLEARADFAATFAPFIEGAEAKPGSLTAITYRSEEGLAHAFQGFEASVGGPEFFYELHAVSKDGLTYLIMSWSLRTLSDNVHEETQKLVAAIQFPGDGTEWAKSARPKTFRFPIGEHELSFQVRPAVFHLESDEDVLVWMASNDNNHVIYAFETEGSADAVLQEAVDAINTDFTSDPLKEFQRNDLQIGETQSRQLVCTNDTYTFHVIAVPLGDDRCLDIRYGTNGPPKRKRSDRELFLDTLSLDEIEQGISLPELTEKTESTPLNKFERAIFDRAEVVGHTELAYLRRWTRLDDGTFLAASGSNAVIVSQSQEESIFRIDRWQENFQLVRWQHRWLATTENGNVVQVSRGVAEPTEIKGRLICPTGDSLYVVPHTSKASLFGMESTPDVGSDALVERTADGREREVARFANQRIKSLSINEDATHALVSGSNLPRLASDQTTYELLLVDLPTGTSQPLGEWRQIDHVNPAGPDWLVTGRPAQRPVGIYRVTASGKADLLLSGSRPAGIAIVADDLFFADADPASDQRKTIYRISLQELEPDGPLCHPFDASVLNAIAHETLVEASALTAPRTKQKILEAFDAASAASRRIVGRDLPRVGFEIDALCSELYGAVGLEPHGKLLVTLLITVCLLDQGAQWIDSPEASPLDWLTPDSASSRSAFAVGHTPSNIFTSTFYNEDGIWDPGTSIVETARGRVIYLGLHSQELRAAFSQAEYTDTERVITTGTAEDVLDLLESRPDNLYLREAVYRRLAALGRTEVLKTVVGEIVDRADSTLLDRKTWYTVRQDSLGDSQSAAEFVEELTAAVEQHPREAVLYLLLGAAYERAQADPRRTSKVCYDRVLEIQRWGEIGQAARDRLASLDANE